MSKLTQNLYFLPCCSSLGPHRVSSSPQGPHFEHKSETQSLLLSALGAKSALKDTLGDSQGLHLERPGLQKSPQGLHFEGLGPQKGPQGHPNGSIWSSLEPCRVIFEPTTAQTNGNPHHQQKPTEPAAAEAKAVAKTKQQQTTEAGAIASAAIEAAAAAASEDTL